MLRDKVIFIAGACGRIGSALASELLRQNAKVILADINEANLERLSLNLRGEFLSLELDITKKESLESAINKAARHFAKIDGFINASYPFGKDWGKVEYYEASYEQICESLNLHLGGFILAANAFVKFFKSKVMEISLILAPLWVFMHLNLKIMRELLCKVL